MKMQHIFRMLREFEATASEGTFKTIFGDYIYKHLWNKFVYHANGNIIAFTRTLDSESNEKLMAYFDLPIQQNKKSLEFHNN